MLTFFVSPHVCVFVFFAYHRILFSTRQNLKMTLNTSFLSFHKGSETIPLFFFKYGGAMISTTTTLSIDRLVNDSLPAYCHTLKEICKRMCRSNLQKIRARACRKGY